MEKKGAGVVGALAGVATGALGMIGQRRRERRSNRQTERLMGMQYDNQRNLNVQGQELAMKTWNETGYEAQKKQMENAGLNPALMYGMGGGGGQTASGGSGGSAASGSATQPQPMELGQALQGAMMQAQVEVMKSQAKKNDAEADSLRGAEGTKGEQEISKSAQEENTEVQKGGYWLQKAVAEAEEVNRRARENEIGDRTKEMKIESIVQEAIGKGLDNEVSKMKINLGEKQMKSLEHAIWQNWVKTGSGVIGNLGGIITSMIKKMK